MTTEDRLTDKIVVLLEEQNKLLQQHYENEARITELITERENLLYSFYQQQEKLRAEAASPFYLWRQFYSRTWRHLLQPFKNFT